METIWLGKPAITRRDFLKIAGTSLALLGMSQALTPKMARALEKSIGKPAVIWLEGQDCAGCSESFLNSLEPPVVSLLLDKISLRYHETIMAASGHQAEAAMTKTIEEGNYILVIEGSIPLAEDGLYCTIGGKTFKDIVCQTAKNAAVIVPVGSCASFGGIPRSGPTDAVGYLFRGTQKHHYFDNVASGKPVINLPTCPLHPERLVAVLSHYLTFGTVPPLDEFHRPLAFYDYLQHDNCERRGHFEAGRFVTDWEDIRQREWCLYLKGCRGPHAYQDCWKRLWNSRTNYCIRANAPCVGCSEPEFYQNYSPLYNRQFDLSLPILGRVDIDKIMAGIAAVAAGGAGAYMGVSALKHRLLNKEGDQQTEKEI
jgi:hydrogenase small subunit